MRESKAVDVSKPGALGAAQCCQSQALPCCLPLPLQGVQDAYASGTALQPAEVASVVAAQISGAGGTVDYVEVRTRTSQQHRVLV